MDQWLISINQFPLQTALWEINKTRCPWSPTLWKLQQPIIHFNALELWQVQTLEIRLKSNSCKIKIPLEIMFYVRGMKKNHYVVWNYFPITGLWLSVTDDNGCDLFTVFTVITVIVQFLKPMLGSISLSSFQLISFQFKHKKQHFRDFSSTIFWLVNIWGLQISSRS